jgi:hypothetical protein
MKRLRLIVIISFISYFSFLISSCTQDSYEKGEGEYSLLRADFVEAYSNAQKQIEAITTDDGDYYSLTKTFTASWVTKADSTYRCILYYNKETGDRGQESVEPVSVGQVPCPNIIPLSELEQKKPMKTDPVKFESAWMSRTGKYLNLSIFLMTGTVDDKGTSQTLHIIQDSVTTNPDDTRTSYLRLFHDQGGVPEYYSSHFYISIPTKSIDADSVRISINTYKDVITRQFAIR